MRTEEEKLQTDYKIIDNSKAFAVNERNEAMIAGGGVVSFLFLG